MEIDIENDEYHLSMMDGSKWFVNPGDLPTIATWLPTTLIQIVDTEDDSMFSFELTNLSENISIRAMRVI